MSVCRAATALPDAPRTRTVGNSIDTDGFVGGGFVGYNYDTGMGIVAGIEGDLGYSGVKGSNAGTEVKSGLDGSIRARLGYTVTPTCCSTARPVARARTSRSPKAASRTSKTALGWTAGVGADVKITQNVFGRAEYRYSDYGSDTFNTGSGARSVDTSDNKVLFGLGVQLLSFGSEQCKKAGARKGAGFFMRPRGPPG